MTNLPHKLTFLEQLRAITQLGLNYSRDPYDQQRYQQLLELALQGYAGEFGLPVTAETLEAGYFEATAPLNWHRDHQQMALQAVEWYQQYYAHH